MMQLLGRHAVPLSLATVGETSPLLNLVRGRQEEARWQAEARLNETCTAVICP
jgi:hypothetical protein